jgi:hypothetical protein
LQRGDDLVLVWWFGAFLPVSPPYRLSFYVYGKQFLGQGIPWMAGALIMTTGALFIFAPVRKPGSVSDRGGDETIEP